MKKEDFSRALADMSVSAAALQDASKRALLIVSQCDALELVPMMEHARDRAHATLQDIVSVLTLEERKHLKRELRRRGIKIRLPRPKTSISMAKGV